MDELENIRKRAKQLVRDHRSRLITLPERIRRSTPGFAGMSDDEILDARFILSDAQRLVAAELGFTSWEELVAAPHLPPPQPGPTGGWRAFVQVFVRDIPSAIDWYREVLSFEVAYVYGSPPFYAQLVRAGVALNLRRTERPPWPTPVPDQDLLAVRFEVDDVKALFLSVCDRGATFHQELRREPWGQRTFIVPDPDGNLLSFGSHMQEPPNWKE
jgi:uncharacterized glyoxalase superfamily protein PhnB